MFYFEQKVVNKSTFYRFFFFCHYCPFVTYVKVEKSVGFLKIKIERFATKRAHIVFFFFVTSKRKMYRIRKRLTYAKNMNVLENSTC